MNEVNKALSAISCPRPVWNLAEDCRIELKGRREFKRSWDWLDWQKMPEEETAVSILYAFKLIDQNRKRRDDYLASDPSGPKGKRSEVFGFYKRICAAKSTLEMIDGPLRRFVSRFRSEMLAAEVPSGPGSVPDGFESLAECLKESGKMVADGTGQDAVYDVEDSDRYLEIEASDDVEADGVIVHEYGCNPWKAGCGDDLKDSILETYANHCATGEVSDNATDEIDTEEFLSRQPDFYEQPDERITDLPKITLIIDCSGSMTSTMGRKTGIAPAQGAIEMLDAVTSLRNEKKLDCVVYLSANNDKQSHRWESYAAKDITRIAFAGGCENIQGTLVKARDAGDLDSDRMVVCYTDGCINDAPIDKDWLMSFGCDPIGAYVGSDKVRKKMEQWFSTILIRPTSTELAEALGQEFAERAVVGAE